MSAQNLYTRQAAAFRNELRTSCAALMGITQGLLADQQLQDSEIRFLHDWLSGADSLRSIWPGTVIRAQVEQVLADGVITEDERAHLVQVLLDLLGGRLDELAQSQHVSRLPLDEVTMIDIEGRSFCFTGDFVFGPRSTCEQAVARRGGTAINSVTRKLHYLVVGGLGSPEWKHGSFGTKIEKAVSYKAGGVPLLIVHEDVWAGSLHNP